MRSNLASNIRFHIKRSGRFRGNLLYLCAVVDDDDNGDGSESEQSSSNYKEDESEMPLLVVEQGRKNKE